MKAAIIYNSRTGTTKKYAEAIAGFLSQKGLETNTASISDYDPEKVKAADIVLLGAWTSGLFFFAQHPDKEFKKYSGNLPEVKDKKVGLFTTYKTLTGSMFRKMDKLINDKLPEGYVLLKSRSSKLTSENKKQLEKLIQNT
ncbi:MAG: flavodoxin domain-containing protein [Bacteroidales bacterium]|nr:flavodoxin family protein [Bacteroidales bacterium]MBS3775970.1 flavodoxin family protein [Bacteroidales bacterium]